MLSERRGRSLEGFPPVIAQEILHHLSEVFYIGIPTFQFHIATYPQPSFFHSYRVWHVFFERIGAAHVTHMFRLSSLPNSLP